jgi:hypothetical protein
MNCCIHLNQAPTYKIEGGLCMSCEKYNCYKCLDHNYNKHIFGKYGKRQLFYIHNNLRYTHPSSEQIKKYKDDDMLSLCFDCVEKINHPSLKNKFKFWICG